MTNLTANFIVNERVSELSFYNDNRIINKYQLNTSTLSKITLGTFLNKIQRYGDAEFEFYGMGCKYVFSCIKNTLSINIFAAGSNFIINSFNIEINESIWSAFNHLKDSLK